MEPNSDQMQGETQGTRKDDIQDGSAQSLRTRRKDGRSSSCKSRKAEEAKTINRKRRRKKKKHALGGQGGEDPEVVLSEAGDQDQTMESGETELETSVEQTPMTAEAEVQPDRTNLSPHLKKRCKVADVLHAHTQTTRCKTKSKETQTLSVTRCNQATQYELADVLGQKEAEGTEETQENDLRLERPDTQQIVPSHPEADTQTDKRADGPSPQKTSMSQSSADQLQSNPNNVPTSSSLGSENAGGSGASVEEKANLKEGVQKFEGDLSGRIAVPEAQLPKDSKAKHPSYAEALSKGAAKEERATDKPGSKGAPCTVSQREMERSQTSGRSLPSEKPLFTFYIHAVLDNKFRFDQDRDQIFLLLDNERFPLTVTHFSELPQKGYLLEAQFFVEEELLTRGQLFVYMYAIQQRNKDIKETALRGINVPQDKNVKELHLFEGFICRMENIWGRFLSAAWNKPKDNMVAESWQFSVLVLLKRTFENWSPSNKESTKNLHRKLTDFKETVGRAPQRIKYLDESHPPMVNVSRLISNNLLDFLEDFLSEGSQIGCQPLLLAFSVFVLSVRFCEGFGMKGLAYLCQVLSSSIVPDSNHLTEVQCHFGNPLRLVLDMIDQCGKLKVSEILLLIPLLHKLRPLPPCVPDMGPTVVEETWSGLDMVKFCNFRESIVEFKGKRRIMMTLIQKHLTVVQEIPLVLRSWLALVALDDIPDFSDLSRVHPGHLIQALLYRFRRHDSDNIAHLNEQAPRILTCIITTIEKERVMDLDEIKLNSIFLSSIDLVKSACKIAQLVPCYRTVLISYQLVLKLAAMMRPVLAQQGQDLEADTSQPLRAKGGALAVPYMKDLLRVQQYVCEWRDNLLQKPLLNSSKKLSYPKEIELWDSLLKMGVSDEEVFLQWRSTVEKDLRKRITESKEEDWVLVCCLDSSLGAIQKCHPTLQTCFHKLCLTAVQRTCQRGKEGDLLQILASKVKVKDIPGEILSSIIVESAARFQDNYVPQLLETQSAISCILSEEWKELPVDDVAKEIVRACKAKTALLVDSLIVGHLHLGDLKTTMEHKEQFKKLYNHYRRNGKLKSIPDDADGILAQREKEYAFFLLQQNHVNTLIKMFGKITESITVSEVFTLEEHCKRDVWSVSLNKLMVVKSLGEQAESEMEVLWYSLSTEVLQMASLMHKLQQSNLILAYWVGWSAKVAHTHSKSFGSVPITLQEAYNMIWEPLLADYSQNAIDIANATIMFKCLDQVLVDAGDNGDGKLIKQELRLMGEAMSWVEDLFDLLPTPETNWVEKRLSQIQEYRQVLGVAAAARSVMQISNEMKLSGDFSEIYNLTQLKEDLFKQRTLDSLSSNLISVKQQLSTVTKQQTVCLDVFLKSRTLVTWVKDNLKNMGDVKVFVELASISAGENDTEIDQVACFHDAVMGYGPLFYTLSPTDGFKEFMTCARLVWEAQYRDEKLPDKLMDSTRLLSWFQGLKETHGSVEQSSLSLASVINERGVYQIGWSKKNTENRCLQHIMCVKVSDGHGQKSYSLEALLELQNKLMLMSSKGEHGKHQVQRFTQLFAGVQRVASILLEMQMSGNMLYREWSASVNCSHEVQPCIGVRFLSFQNKLKEFHGDVTEKLQQLGRSMETCHKEWCLFISEQRSIFHMLNHFTSEQLVYLCHWIYSVCHRQAPAPQQLWHLLNPIKTQCTPDDIRTAFENATGMTLRQTAEKDVVGLAEDLMQFSSEEDDDPQVEDNLDLDCSSLNKGEDGEKSLEDMWREFKDYMPEYLYQHLDIPTLAQILACLSDMSQQHVSRNLPSCLEEGKPNLVLCPAAEVLTTALALYSHSPEQPLPSTDEVLVCREGTPKEEVDIFLRRALGQGSKIREKRIYSLVNPGLLGYEVSVALGERFEDLESCAGVHYRLVIVSPLVHQHRYVPSFFSNHKVQAGVTVTAKTAVRYIRHHFTITDENSPVSMISPEKLSVWVVSSQRPAVGKSLYVDRLFQKFREKCALARKITIRLIEPHIDIDSMIQTLSDQLASMREQDPILLHIDTPAVNSGLEEFLFQLLVLRCLCDSQGTLWRRNLTHLFMIEVMKPCKPKQSKEVKLGLLDLLPTIHCRSPKEVQDLLLSDPDQRRLSTKKDFDPLMDEQEFFSEGIQRPYQFLKLFSSRQNLDPFKYQEVEGSPQDCLKYFLSNCGMPDPSWAELKNFSWFLNVQLKDCENSIFCDRDFLADQLPGFKAFIVKFMILMARDFASPSMDSTHHQNLNPEDDLLPSLTIRKHWESEAHPYIFFNADHFSMSFLGFYVKECHGRNTFDAVDLQSKQVLIKDVMTTKLFEGLERQRICLTEDFDRLDRQEKIKRISRVVGANMNKHFDPDPTYELTSDNVRKMLAIHMRFRCGIPVIIMGETGCGKTRLVRFLCDLQKEGREIKNLKLVKVHGGTTSDMIYRRVREAEILADRNLKTDKLDTILFFDEANTTEAIFAIKEILCDQTIQGTPLKSDSGLKIIAACNPYRKHTPEMVKRLERAGLGYRVKAEETEDRLGKVPLRQLVYRVRRLPPSMAALVWDFGQLSDATELSYIKQIVQRKVDGNNLPVVCKHIISNVLAASQQYMRHQKNECSFVSLRDVERSMTVMVWFFKHASDFQNLNNLTMTEIALTCLVLAVGVCYYPSLVRTKPYLSHICRYFPDRFNSAEVLEQVISGCQDFLLENIQTRETIAKNTALKENVFLMVICIQLKIPLFLVGKPGSSKSLAKTVVSDAMQGQNSHVELFKKLKQVHMVSFQCSPYSSPEGIIGTFRNCARFQKDKNMDEYVSVVVLDEIGLAEDSPQMPLKTLHPLLEDGCIDNDRPDPHMKVGFVGISNWALDPAKMNRGIFVSRWDPSEKELVETAKGICLSSESVFLKIKHLFPPLAKAFLEICKKTANNQFFGLRDYYSLVKMIFSIVSRSNQEPNDRQLVEAILHNFSGQPEGFDPLMFFNEVFKNLSEVPRPSALQMIKNNLDFDGGHENRYLLLLTTNNAALYMIQQHIFANGDQVAPEIVFGSGFPKDQEYSQVCRNVNRVKTCMETGRTVILLNMQNLYESLYDALNQYYVYLSQQQYVDLGLGSHRVKCRVHRRFRLIVVEDQKKVYEQFPVPLINRLEKHRVGRSTDLTPWQRRVLEKLGEWVRDFLGQASKDFTVSDVFVGFHDDACASALLQALEKRPQTPLDNPVRQQREQPPEGDINKDAVSPDDDARDTLIDKDQSVCDSTKNIDTVTTENLVEGGDGNSEEELLELAKCLLLNCATPDSVLRLKNTDVSITEKRRRVTQYFQQQCHHSLQGFLKNHLNKPQESKRFLEVTTFSSLLTASDVKTVVQFLGLQRERLLLLSLHQFDTEASFYSKIRSFVQDVEPSPLILIVQIDLDEHCSEELIASAKYCTMNYLMSLDHLACWVVFIAKLSRIPSRSQYIGFQGGIWHSIHIDDLRETEDMSLNLSVFCATPVSKLLQPQTSGEKMDMECTMKTTEEEKNICPKEPPAHLHRLSLVRSCVQKAVGLLRDPRGVPSRSLERIHTLLVLLGNNKEDTKSGFHEVLLGRLARALALKEESEYSPADWLNAEARKRQALQEGGTLRHTLWRCLQSRVTPILASVVEVLDRGSNLDLLRDGQMGQGLRGLWLDIFSDEQILDLTPPQTQSTIEREILVQYSLFLDGVQQPCAAPFSWLFKSYLQSLWDESEFIPVTNDHSTSRIQQFVGAFDNSRLGGYLQKLSVQERGEYSERFLQDFLLLSFKITKKAELTMFTNALSGCVYELQFLSTCASSHLSPAWVVAGAKHYASRLHTLSHTMLLDEQLASEVNQLGRKRESTEMIQDILALGICVEKTKLLTVTSLEECERFVHRVELLQPCLDRAFSHNYSALCGPGCLQHLTVMRSTWYGMLVIAAFIQRVLFEAPQNDARLKELALKHCSLLQHLMRESPDLWNVVALKQLIRILNSYYEQSTSRLLRYGLHCCVCLSELNDPCILPCEHVVCLPCIMECIRKDRRFCPTCRTDLPPELLLTVSDGAKAALRKQALVRASCTAFFLEVVSRFCLSPDQCPSGEVVELLFSLLISTHGDVYQTRALSPFLECVDSSPVVRSVLPKLLLQHSFDQVKVHIQNYLRNLEENILPGGDRTGLYLLFVNCFQDSLLCSEVEELDAPQGRHKRHQEERRFLSRLARGQTPDRQEDPAEFLLNLARLRLCLATAAHMLITYSTTESAEERQEYEQYLQQVRAVLDYRGNDWYRVYLLRAVHRQANRDFITELMRDSNWGWLFPPEVLRIQSMIPLEVDQFLCVSPQYRALRDTVAQSLLEQSADALQRELQKHTGPQGHVLLALALFRQVTCRCILPEVKLRPSEQERKKLQDVLRNPMAEALQAFCTALLSNQIGGSDSSLHISQGLPSGRRALLELLVHQDSVLLSGNPLLAPLGQIAFQTQSATQFFLPTMPDDHTSEAQQWLRGEKVHKFRCTNGHICFVGECGKPMATSKCIDCGIPVGGHNHSPVPGFQRLDESLGDQTRRGHILGEARRSMEAPERQMTPAQNCVLRLLTHLALLQAASRNRAAVSGMVHPTPRDVVAFLWSHLEQDVATLGRTLDLNADDTAVTAHLILSQCMEVTPGWRGERPDLTSRQGRAKWEIRVCVSVIDPVLENLKGILAEARERITADSTLEGSPLMRLLYADPGPLLSLPSGCPTQRSAFWSLPETVTVERFSQLVGQSPSRGVLPLLVLFLEKISCIRQLQHLPELAALQSDLMRIFPVASSDTTSQSIAQMLHRYPAGHGSKVVSGRVRRFIDVWNLLRRELAHNATELGLEVKLCETPLTMDSSGDFLVPCRRGPGSCLRTTVDFLLNTNNSLVTVARKINNQEHSDYSVQLEGISDTQLARCHPEKQLLPLVLSHCQYTLKEGKETDRSYDLNGIQTQLARRFLAGKPLIQADTERFLNRHLQDFSDVLSEVRHAIPQNPLKGSVCGAVRSVLRSYTDVCNGVFVIEIGLRFLAKTGGQPGGQLMSYLTQSLQIGPQISSIVAKALGECRLEHSVFTWQLLTCWKSELLLKRQQDPFQGLRSEFSERLTAEERKGLGGFLSITDTGDFCRELHEILLLKTSGSVPDLDYQPHWDIRTTLQTHLDQKGLLPLQGLDSLSEDIALAKGADVWRTAVEFRRG